VKWAVASIAGLALVLGAMGATFGLIQRGIITRLQHQITTQARDLPGHGDHQRRALRKRGLDPRSG
jgi:hypothetical protein